jgi:GNAT superfamily N-acetyltransferase
MAEQWTLVAEIERQVIMAEADAGLSIPGAVRPLTDAEILAKVRFADIAALQDMAAQQSQEALDLLRYNLTNELIDTLGASVDDAMDAAPRLMKLLQQPSKNVRAAIAEAAGTLEKVFSDVYAGAVGIVHAEVQTQNIRPANFDSLKPPAAVLSVQAQSIAGQDWTRLADKVQKNHLTPSAIVHGSLTREAVQATLDGVSKAGTLDAARQAIHTAHGAGRIDAGDMQGCSDIWASELLDGRTCEACAKIDGFEYASMAAAKADYPMGGYKSCAGEQRCRGTLVFLYRDPVPGTGVDDNGNVTGTIEMGPGETPLPPAQDTPPPAPPGTLRARIIEAVDTIDPAKYLLPGETMKGFVDAATEEDPYTPNMEQQIAKGTIEALHSDFAARIDMPAGYKVQLDEVQMVDQRVAVNYFFTDPDGDPVGKSQRVYFVQDGKLTVDHDSLMLDEDHQGHGIGARFLAASEALYRKLGVQQIVLHANIDVGGYAWAKAGFDWKDWNSAGALASGGSYFSDLRLRVLAKTHGFSDEEVAAFKAVRESMTKEAFDNGTIVTPYDVAMVGYEPGRANWIGKQAMLNSAWMGKKAL